MFLLVFRMFHLTLLLARDFRARYDHASLIGETAGDMDYCVSIDLGHCGLLHDMDHSYCILAMM